MTYWECDQCGVSSRNLADWKWDTALAEIAIGDFCPMNGNPDNDCDGIVVAAEPPSRPAQYDGPPESDITF